MLSNTSSASASRRTRNTRVHRTRCSLAGSGADLAEEHREKGDPPFQPTNPARDCTYVAETSHNLCGLFRDYWQGHGLEFGDPAITYRESLALFGYPLSEAFTNPVTGLTTQYFERAVFEHHPDNPEPYRVLLRRLGAEALERRGW